MSASTVVFILIAIVSVLQIALSVAFLEHVKRDNRAEYDRICSDKENFWFSTNPLSVGLLYVLPNTYKLWNLSQTGIRIALCLKFVSIMLVILVCCYVATLFHDLLLR